MERLEINQDRLNSVIGNINRLNKQRREFVAAAFADGALERVLQDQEKRGIMLRALATMAGQLQPERRLPFARWEFVEILHDFSSTGVRDRFPASQIKRSKGISVVSADEMQSIYRRRHGLEPRP